MKIGIFTSSTPIGSLFPKRAERAKKFLESKGHTVILGNLFFENHQHVAGSPKQRAEEIHKLVSEGCDLLMSSIGGSNTSSILPFLNFEMINEKGIIFCGFSDTTSLLSAISRKCSRSRVIYGPAFMPNFGEIEDYSKEFSYEQLFKCIECIEGKYSYVSPNEYYSSFENWEFYEKERTLKTNEIEFVHYKDTPEEVSGVLFGGNGNTLMSIMGTDFFNIPGQTSSILLLEDNDKTSAELERIYSSFILSNTLNNVSAVLFGKSYKKDFKNMSAVNIFRNLLEENGINIPIVYDLDISHFKPMSCLELNRKTYVNFVEKTIFQI